MQKPGMLESKIQLDTTFADNFGHICRQIMHICRKFIIYDRNDKTKWNLMWKSIIQHSGVYAYLVGTVQDHLLSFSLLVTIYLEHNR